jgi:predicted RNA binding protein YcfA (HicA-like mRNA interferase family)
VENFAKPLKKILIAAGWRLLRQGKGDHEVWHNPDTGQTVTLVTFMKSRHLANAILKDAGLPKVL